MEPTSPPPSRARPCRRGEPFPALGLETHVAIATFFPACERSSSQSRRGWPKLDAHGCDAREAFVPPRAYSTDRGSRNCKRLRIACTYLHPSNGGVRSTKGGYNVEYSTSRIHRRSDGAASNNIRSRQGGQRMRRHRRAERCGHGAPWQLDGVDARTMAVPARRLCPGPCNPSRPALWRQGRARANRRQTRRTGVVHRRGQSLYPDADSRRASFRDARCRDRQDQSPGNRIIGSPRGLTCVFAICAQWRRPSYGRRRAARRWFDESSYPPRSNKTRVEAPSSV